MARSAVDVPVTGEGALTPPRPSTPGARRYRVSLPDFPEEKPGVFEAPLPAAAVELFRRERNIIHTEYEFFTEEVF